MKRIFTLTILLFAISFNNLYCQTINSTTNGNFLNPLTWDCMCIPSTATNINVKHKVVLNTDWQVNGGSITVVAGGSLIKDATGRSILLSAGSITVNDMMDIKWLSITDGTLVVNDTLKVKSFYNDGVIANYNSITSVDSFYNGNLLYNLGNIDAHTFFNADTLVSPGNFSYVDSATNAGVFSFTGDAVLKIGRFTNLANFGTTSAQKQRFSDFTNIGTFYAGVTEVDNNLYNTGTLYLLDSLTVGYDLLNTGYLYMAGSSTKQTKFTVTNNFANVDSANHTCLFFMEYCDATILGDFYNRDTVASQNSSSMIVYGNSYNEGLFYGQFDFCDATPLQLDGSPDLNTGTIDATVTFCSAVSVAEKSQSNFTIYPNPANNQLTISGSTASDYTLINALGQTVKQGKVEPTISTKDIAEGNYVIRFTNPKNNKTSFERVNIIH